MGKDDLIEAARLGNYPVCEKILSSKPKKPGPFASLRRGSGGCNSRDCSGYTALHYAALNGHLDIVELLLSYEASCNSADDKGSSPLHLAAWAGHAQIVEILMTRGPSIANVNLTNADKETALHSAAQYGHLEAVQLLLKHGADPNIKNSKDETPLDLAALYGRTDTVRQLLDSHPELVGPYTAYGGAMYCHTPLHLASRNGHKDVVDLILRTGFDINARTARGTALHEAALCGKIEVVKSLLEAGVNVELRDQDDKTVLEIMNELRTSRTREIIHIILDFMGIRRRSTMTSAASMVSSTASTTRAPHSPYDNLSLTQSLEESFSIDLEFGSANTSRASSRCLESPLHMHHASASAGAYGGPAGRAKSVEDIVDRRVSSLSTTSGCSDCTTATLQGAKSYGSSFFSGDEMATPRLLGSDLEDADENTSLSSNDDFSSNHSQVLAVNAPPSDDVVGAISKKGKSSTLTREADPPPPLPTVAVNKPQVPAKPAHIRPGLKPVKIPTVDDKVWQGASNTSTAPRKPPRRNVSVSPIRGCSSKHQFHTMSGSASKDQLMNYYSKTASKSFDELDDILTSEKKAQESTTTTAVAVQPTTASSVMMKNSPSSSMMDEASASSAASRHSCDELMMTRSLYEAETSDDAGSQVSGSGGGNVSTGCNSSGTNQQVDCQRCLLNTLSNRTMSLDCNELVNSSRFISQRQYKRKLKRECPSYATMDRSKASKRSISKKSSPPSNNISNSPESEMDLKMKMVSKTTFKLREDFSANSEDELELMEIPLSPTHYQQPPTPDHEPPSPFQAERTILKVLDNLRNESKRMRRSKFTDIEPGLLLPLGKTTWPSKEGVTTADAVTVTTDIEGKSLRYSRPELSSCSPPPSTRPRSSNGVERSQLRLDDLGQQPQVSSHLGDWGREHNGGRHSVASASASAASESLSILSPFDEKEEWHKISEILNSFGSNIGKDVKASTTPNNSPNEDENKTWKKKNEKIMEFKTLLDFLKHYKMEKYQKQFMEHGYDDIDFVGEDVINDADLARLGINDTQDQLILMEAFKKKGYSQGSTQSGLKNVTNLTLKEWLTDLRLVEYMPTFQDNLYSEMDRVKNIWDDELTSLLDIEKIGHRKRILLSLAGREGILNRFGKVQMDTKDTTPVVAMEVDCKITTENTKKTSTLGRSRKKKAAPQPPGSTNKGSASDTEKSTTATSSKNKNSATYKSASSGKKSGGGAAASGSKSSTKHQSPPSEEFLAFKVRYYAKRSGKDFKGVDTTKSAIESSKKSKGGRQRFLVLSEKDVKILKRDAKELVTSHEISNVCCVVRDNLYPNTFGYVTATESGQSKNTAHVFTTDSPEKASEILSVICEGYNAKKPALEKSDKLEPHSGTPSPPESSASNKGFKSDHIVSRMKLFFQGKDTQNPAPRSQSPQPQRRKRGGSVDNLLDDLGDVIAPSSMTRESKKKSMSSKNLSLNSTRETSNAAKAAQQGQGAAAASGSLAATERITTV